MTQYRQILRLHSQGISQRSIAHSCQCSRNTVAAVLQRASAANLTWPLDGETDADLEQLLFPEKREQVSLRRMPDFERVSKELARSGVTLKLRWIEYCEECRQLGEQPFMYSQFCYHFQQYTEKERATMHIPRKPGDRIEVDWAGDKLYIVDRDTGEAIPVYLFVGVLPFSMHAYAEGCLRMDMENWTHVHVNMFQYFGGSAVMLVPDNLKAGVDHAGDWYTPQINHTYRELADKHSVARLENACARAFTFTPQPSYKSIKNILVTGQSKLEIAPAEKSLPIMNMVSPGGPSIMGGHKLY